MFMCVILKGNYKQNSLCLFNLEDLLDLLALQLLSVMVLTGPGALRQ